MVCSSEKINSKFIQLFCDNLGRWTGQYFLGKQFHQIHFITIYIPCQKKLDINKKGKTTAYAQQEQLLRIRQRKYVEPQKVFLHDLRKLLNSLRKQSSSNNSKKSTHQSIIGGDWNRVFENYDQLLGFCTKNESINIMHDCNGFPNFGTYARGFTIIDFPLISLSLKNSVHSCGYLLFADIIHSDPCGFYLFFQYKILFGKFPDLLPCIQFWKLWWKNRILAAFYIWKLHYVLNQQNVFEGVRSLFPS